MSRRVIKNAEWELGLNLALIPIPIIVFIKNGFLTKDMGPGGPFLYFAYLTHVKDIAVMAGIAVPDAIRARNAIKERNTLTSPLSIQEDNEVGYVDLESTEWDKENALLPTYEITDTSDSLRTFVRYQTMNLVITADLLFYILVAPHVEEPKTSLDYAVLALTVLNHSFDALVLFPKFIRYNTPLYTSGTLCKRVLKEYVAPVVTDASYAATCLYALQKAGVTDEKGNTLYPGIDFEKDPIGTLILCAVLAVGMPAMNKMIFVISGAIQFGIHSPAGSVKAEIKSFGNKLGQCFMGAGRSVYNVFTSCCRPRENSSAQILPLGKN